MPRVIQFCFLLHCRHFYRSSSQEWLLDSLLTMRLHYTLAGSLIIGASVKMNLHTFHSRAPDLSVTAKLRTNLGFPDHYLARRRFEAKDAVLTLALGTQHCKSISRRSRSSRCNVTDTGTNLQEENVKLPRPPVSTLHHHHTWVGILLRRTNAAITDDVTER